MAKLNPVPHLWVGTSGWTYDDWNGVFYPPDVKGSARLDYYVTQFHAVELNATFYRYPTSNMVTAWNQRMPAGFHLAVKALRRITHVKRLQECTGDWTEFSRRIRELHCLRVILWQLPPSLDVDLPRLASFLEMISQSPIANVRHAFEFRNKRWWTDEVAHLLEKEQAAFVAISHPTLPSQIIPTTDFLYVRFHGLGRQLYRYDYSRDELAEWVERVIEVCGHRCVHDVYAFFNNDFQANAVKNAKAFENLFLNELNRKKYRTTT
jgi:uncharacterized protein YecE (DUF72 family)